MKKIYEIPLSFDLIEEAGLEDQLSPGKENPSLKSTNHFDCREEQDVYLKNGNSKLRVAKSFEEEAE